MQETHVEQFRRMLEAKAAWRREDHGECSRPATATGHQQPTRRLPAGSGRHELLMVVSSLVKVALSVILYGGRLS